MARRKSVEVNELKERINKAKKLGLAEEVRDYMIEALTVAYDFYYPIEVSEKILKCTTETQIASIMTQSRIKYV